MSHFDQFWYQFTNIRGLTATKLQMSWTVIEAKFGSDNLVQTRKLN